MKRLLLAFALAIPTALPVVGTQVEAEAPAIFQPGTYQGAWKDGQILTENIWLLNGDAITIQRLGTNTPVVFNRIGYNRYQNVGGSTLTILDNRTLMWMNVHGGNRVIYAKTRRDM